MSKNTPGPWMTEPNGQGGIAIVGKNTFTGINECTVAHAFFECDGRLIAAAPELLAALRELLDAPADLDESAWEARTRAARVAACAAIAKAEGRT